MDQRASELCGTDLQRDSHKCVVEWLTGDRIAYTDKTHNIAIEADWSNGNVAMTGCSYGGTLPYEVATTGVKGLKTIIPIAGIASWYDYTNSQGVPTLFDVNYADSLAAFNCLTVAEPSWIMTGRFPMRITGPGSGRLHRIRMLRTGIMRLSGRNPIIPMTMKKSTAPLSSCRG